MSSASEWIHPFLSQVQQWNREKRIGEVIFSEGTYEVEVRDPQVKKTFWPFIQMDDEGKILDAFCPCATSEEQRKCLHIAAALVHIYHDTDRPLHVRFRNSLWNRLCQAEGALVGYDPTLLSQESSQRFSFLSPDGNALFAIEAVGLLAKEKLYSFLRQRKVETEETSLKFSKLSLEEIAQWKAGRASLQLRYELSFWSDIAKWLFFLQEEGFSYQIDLKERENHCPYEVQVAFEQIRGTFFVPEEDWPAIIPSFTSVNSPWKVYDLEAESIEQIVYDEKSASFSLSLRDSPLERDFRSLSGYSLGPWKYAPQKGFYSRHCPLYINKTTIAPSEVAFFLSTHRHLLDRFLVNTKIHRTPRKIQFFLFFDKEEQLHITSYLFEPNDLFQEGSSYFESWVYLKGRGFFSVEPSLFLSKETIIPKEQISDFVRHYHDFLLAVDGFSPHLEGIRANLSYAFSKEGDLQLVAAVGNDEGLDFGEWVYLSGKGFYLKKTEPSLFLGSGLVVKKEDIGSFIRTQRDLLEHVPGFFLEKNPIRETGVRIDVDAKKHIRVRREVRYEEGFSSKDVTFYDGVLYVQGRGFYLLSESYSILKKFKEERTIFREEEAYFIEYELDKLRPFTLYLDPRLRVPSVLTAKVLRVSSGEERGRKRFFVDLAYQSDQGQASAVDLWDAFQERRKYCFSSAGLISLKAPRYQWIQALGREALSDKELGLQLSPLEWMRLCSFEEIDRSPFEQGKEGLLEEPFHLAPLKATLRSYQLQGVHWLWFLYSNGFSGLLCDEMGLGKTHQAMALLAATFAKNPSCKYLVVCPTSVIYHWQELISRFLPDLRLCVYHGPERSLEGLAEKFDLVLTSYGLVRAEADLFSSLFFEVIIFDEFHFAKNQASKIHKALRGLRSSMRLGLTGTPIENRLRELKALFDLVLPSYLPKEASFREFFTIPIEKENDEQRRQLLSRLVRPFILRRKKEEVLKDLPEKTEKISYCDLSEEQAALYREALRASRKGLLQELEAESQSLPYLHIFALLTRLKQICNHPSLLLGDSHHYHRHQSGKWDLFVELLEEARESKQKVVVFSQYLDMLSIVELYLKKQGISWASIKGSTLDRGEQLLRFREDPNCEVFVASLLAAGVGIDLSSASVVIHYDRWWNPAKENQATDRVHRIGQSRGVQVFKLVTKNTVEEYIDQLIEKKKGLLEKTVETGEGNWLRFCSRGELIGLLQQIAKIDTDL